MNPEEFIDKWRGAELKESGRKELDAAVAAAYGWPEDISDEEALKKLFELNQERARKQKVAK